MLFGVTDVWQHNLVTLTLTLSSKIEKWKINKNKNKNKNEKKVKSIIFDLDITCVSGMIPLLVVLVLRNAKIHVDSSNHSDITSYIKVPVNKTLCFHAILRIPNVNPNHGYVRFRRNLDNFRTEY